MYQLEQDMKNESIEVRRQAVICLATREGPRADKLLIDALGDPAVPVRRAAVLALRRSSNPTTVRALIGIIRDDPDEIARGYAAFVMGVNRLPVPDDEFVRIVKDRSWKVRVAGCWAIGMRGVAMARETLFELLSDPSPDVRWQACAALVDLEVADRRILDAIRGLELWERNWKRSHKGLLHTILQAISSMRHESGMQPAIPTESPEMAFRSLADLAEKAHRLIAQQE